jgi:hypothetical protein
VGFGEAQDILSNVELVCGERKNCRLQGIQLSRLRRRCGAGATVCLADAS